MEGKSKASRLAILLVVLAALICASVLLLQGGSNDVIESPTRDIVNVNADPTNLEIVTFNVFGSGDYTNQYGYTTLLGSDRINQYGYTTILGSDRTNQYGYATLLGSDRTNQYGYATIGSTDSFDQWGYRTVNYTDMDYNVANYGYVYGELY